MTQNKFWLVSDGMLGITGDSEVYKYDTFEKAVGTAKEKSFCNPFKAYTIFEATHHFKANVNVIETDLTTPEESLAVAPSCKFAVDDLVLLNNKLYYIINLGGIDVEIAPIDSDIKKSRLVSIKDVTKVENPRTRQEYFAKLAEPTTPETPKHEFKVGDIICTQCVITKKQIKAKIMGFYNQKFCYIDVLEGDHKDNNIYPFDVKSLTLAEPTPTETPTDFDKRCTPKHEFEFGDRVKHEQYGIGRVATKSKDNYYPVYFDTDEAGTCTYCLDKTLKLAE